MAGRDILSQILADLRLGIGLFTRLPLAGEVDMQRGASSAWAWPLAGLLPAVIGLIAISVSVWLGLSAGFSAALGMALMIMGTGAMHEDGLADTADGFWGGWDPARRLEIMKDSRIGTYGVIALLLTLLARWSILSSLIAAGTVWGPLLAASVLSRAPMVGLMALMSPARPDGLSRAVGRPDLRAFGIGGGVALVVAMALTGWAALPASVAALIAAGLLGKLAQSKIGGQTGDVLGAAQQLAEVSVLAVLAAYLF